MRKAEFLKHWKTLVNNEPPKLEPCPIAYSKTGSSYDEDGIRITGSRTWIDSVLARLTDLLACENGQTRLQVNYQQSKDRDTGELIDGWNCYVQVRQRGAESQRINAKYNCII